MTRSKVKVCDNYWACFKSLKDRRPTYTKISAGFSDSD